jgi:hypothetical protein
MMEKNPFAGINPHLNSYLQATGRWEGFHNLHIAHLVEALEMQLPPEYGSLIEESMQISRISPSDETRTRSGTKPDILIYQQSTSERGGTGIAVLTPPVAEFPLTEVDEDEETLSAIIVYQLSADASPGIPVTWIELLSPANKPGGSHFPRYRQKRLETLHSGLNLVELDYLHETRPILSQLPSYPDGDTGAFPYLVIVSKPHPTFETGVGRIYGAVVDQPLPTIELPLAGDEAMAFNLGPPYDRTCASTRIFRQQMDATRLPEPFDRYRAADQERIRQRMAVIAQQD